MAICATCGEKNPDSASFCAKCGKPLAETGKSASDIALENAQKQFDSDAKVNVDKDKITYICELCGTINKIDNPKCVKCGKPRPRKEFVDALRKIRDGEDAREEMIAEKQAAEIAAREAEEQAAKEKAAAADAVAQNPIPEEEKKPLPQLYRQEVAPQNQAIRQPFVIVPYVDSHQKLWQYQPKQVYRYQPYTFEEKTLREEKVNELVNGVEPTTEELLRLRDRKEREIAEINSSLLSLEGEDERFVKFQKNAKKVRVAAGFSLVFSIILLVAALALPLLRSMAGYKGVELFKSLGNCFSAVGIDLGFSSASFTYVNWTSWVIPVAYVAVGIIGIIIFISSIIRLVTGRARVKGFVLPLIAFFISLFVAGILINISSNGFNDILSSLQDFSYGFYAVIASSLALFIIGCCATKNAKVN